MQDLFKVLHFKSLNRLFAYSLIFIFSISLVLALDECKGGVVLQEEVPCLILLQFNETPLVCGEKSVSLYNESTFLFSTPMANYSPFFCSAIFNESTLGTYNFKYDTADTGSIIVEGGIRLINLLYFGIILIVLFLGFGFWKEDLTFLNLGSILAIVIGVFIAINGFNNLNNIMTQAIAAVIWGLGGYVGFKANYDFWKANL